MSASYSRTDQAIATAIAGGGRARELALEQWFADESLHRWVSQYACQHGGTDADGEDLYHDTFITFDRLLREGKFREEASLRTFFCSIAKWLWLNHQRKTGRTQTLSETDFSTWKTFTDEEMYDRERQKLMEQLLTTLGDKCKKLLTLYQQSFNMKEIAAEMGYGSDQVAMNQCSECRKKLKILIENNVELKEFFKI
ncbi:MAG: RNA polymerase sigma factor [Saprospiraceae bacterium]|nr:RNA polymerase sigma factor [Saprospiraceae bacterium]